jgi:hypothetical protein
MYTDPPRTRVRLKMSRIQNTEYELSREMKNISTFGDFVTILPEKSMQDVMVERSRVIFTAITITRKILQCYCVHRVVYLYTLNSFLTTVIPADITKGESALYSNN